MNQEKIDLIGIILLSVFFILLFYAGYISHKSIDNDVLKKMESQQLALPTQTPLSTIILAPSPTTGSSR